MRARTFVIAASLAATMIAAGPVEGEPGDVTEDGYTIVGVDPAGDWNSGDGTEVGDALAQDLTGASMRMVPDAEVPTVEFRIHLNSLPPNGGVPEFTRYTWGFTVDGEEREWDGKWLNYTRGACDPTSGQCPPPRDPGMQPFFLRGECGVNTTLPINFTACEELANVPATFDAAAGTIAVAVDIETLGAVPCSLIKPGSTIFGGSISAAPSAFLSINSAAYDFAFMDVEFQIPSEDGSPCPPPAE